MSRTCFLVRVGVGKLLIKCLVEAVVIVVMDANGRKAFNRGIPLKINPFKQLAVLFDGDV